MKVLMIAPYVTINSRPEFSRNKTGFGYMVMDIAKAVGNKMWQTRIFNPVLKLLSMLPQLGFIHKAFGSIAYDMSLSNHFDGKYRVVSYEESIQRIAKAHMKA